MRIDHNNAQLGFTLPEATLALVILGMVAAGVLLPFAGGARVQAEGMHRTLAAKLANDLMERIVATTRANVLSWDGYVEAPGQVKDATGAAFTDSIYAKFSRQASCESVWIASGPPQTANFVLIKVSVAWDGREIVTLSGMVNL